MKKDRKQAGTHLDSQLKNELVYVFFKYVIIKNV